MMDKNNKNYIREDDKRNIMGDLNEYINENN
jgi:hypothetical protein